MSSPPPSSPAAPKTGQQAVDMIAMVFERVAESLEQVENALHAQLDSESELIGAVGDHVFDSGGKRLRPALLWDGSSDFQETSPTFCHPGNGQSQRYKLPSHRFPA